MKSATQNTPLRALLWIICFYHQGIAVVAQMPASAVTAAAASVLGMTLPDEQALFQVIKSFGVYSGAFGLMMGLAAWDPIKNRAMISVGAALFGLRVLQRLTNIEALESSFGMAPSRSAGTVVIVGMIGAALAWYRLAIWREMKTKRAQP